LQSTTPPDAGPKDKDKERSMSTLSLGLRGSGLQSVDQPPAVSGARWSVAIHGVGLAALLASPLWAPVIAPDIAGNTKSILLQPVLTVPELPPEAPRVSLVRAGSPRNTAARAVTPATAVPPTTTPLTLDLNAGDVLDQAPGVVGDTSTGQDGPGGTGGAVGDCMLGAMCGTGTGPTTPAASEPVRVGGVIDEPKLIESRPPVYPSAAQSIGLSGFVILETHVGRDGHVIEAKILRGHPVFNDAAVESVKSRRYKPLLLNGVPTEFLLTVTMQFTIKR
jgi:periplasmic protein TonB